MLRVTGLALLSPFSVLIERGLQIYKNHSENTQKSITHTLANSKSKKRGDDDDAAADAAVGYAVLFALIRFNFTQHLSGKYWNSILACKSAYEVLVHFVRMPMKRFGHFNAHAMPNEHSNKVQANILYFCQQHSISPEIYICIECIIQQKVGRYLLLPPSLLLTSFCCFSLSFCISTIFHEVPSLTDWLTEYFIDFTYFISE